jgi:hypothetical protein
LFRFGFTSIADVTADFLFGGDKVATKQVPHARYEADQTHD